MGGRAPGYRLSADHFQKVKRMLAPDWAQKMLCIIVPNRRTVSLEFSSWVRTRRLFTRSRLVWLMHQKKCTQSGNFQFDINSPAENTVYPKIKDAFPKIQAWAYNRYSLLHRSHLLKYSGVITKGPFTWRWGTPGGWGNPLRWDNPPVQIISHFNVITFTC